MTPDEAKALRIRLTTTQAQRLRELGADPLVLDGAFTDAPARDTAFKQLEDSLVHDGRQRLKEMRFWLPPSASITKICGFPARSLTKTILPPSGEKHGEVSPSLLRVRRTGLDPSGLRR